MNEFLGLAASATEALRALSLAPRPGSYRGQAPSRADSERVTNKMLLAHMDSHPGAFYRVTIEVVPGVRAWAHALECEIESRGNAGGQKQHDITTYRQVSQAWSWLSGLVNADAAVSDQWHALREASQFAGRPLEEATRRFRHDIPKRPATLTCGGATTAQRPGACM
jgi:hypothetical protein